MTLNQTETSNMDADFFNFPYKPYDIQLDLMKKIWSTIDSGNIGIFESPTGTGKSMSLICGALSWLTKNTDQTGLLLSKDQNDLNEAGNKENAEPDWLQSYGRNNLELERKEQERKAKEALLSVEDIRKETLAQKKKRKISYTYHHHEHKRTQMGYKSSRLNKAKSELSVKKDDSNDEEHLVDEYDSDPSSKLYSDDSEEDKKTEKKKWKQEEKETFGIIKIIYCSRTHSQISQFIREIKHTSFGDRIRCISLGSRKNLCTNPQVNSLRSDLQMSDKCLDMLQGKSTKKKKNKSSKTKCPFYDRTLLDHYKNHALSQVHDIEDLYELGEEMSVCSYYGSRASIPLAQVIGMPYSMLLSKDTRESMGIELEGNIVIFDEAHNIVEAMNHTYSVQITTRHLTLARRSLWSYFKCYEKRFKGKNSFYIKQLLSLLELLVKFLRETQKELLSKSTSSNTGTLIGPGSSSTGKMLAVDDFLFAARMDHFNIFKLLQYLEESKLAKKLMGFVEMKNTPSEASSSAENQKSTKVSKENQDEDFIGKQVSPLRTIEAFLRSLTSASADGRILAQPTNAREGVEGMLKFILLNPSTHFREIVDKSRSVIMAGGTMHPVSEVISQLFPHVLPEKVDLFSCGHVIPPENLIAFPLGAGPTAEPFEFTFSRRHRTEALDELGRVLQNLARVVPGGIVLFFPSYRFEEVVFQRWLSDGRLNQICTHKKLFREPKNADELDKVLQEYATAAKGQSGAILTSVVGGKMSEGINFSDDLARCVVMVGLPYPNAQDPELVEKMNFFDTNPSSGTTGREFYENLCMKAVNQSIGRAIRHQKDYASILLLDRRYSNPSIRKRLPLWIQKRVQQNPGGISSTSDRPTMPLTFGQVYPQLIKFYRSKK